MAAKKPAKPKKKLGKKAMKKTKGGMNFAINNLGTSPDLGRTAQKYDLNLGGAGTFTSSNQKV